MKASFTKDAKDLLGGLGAGSARRGKTVLRLIYARVSDRVKAHAQSPTNLYQSDTLRDTRNLAYLDAVASGAKNPNPPACTIQDIEKYAHDWADLVPRSPAIQADLAMRMSDSYAFEARHVPGIIAALCLDDAETAEEFRAKTGAEIASIYAATTPLRQRLRWTFSRASGWIENLPAFWASFALTITSTLGPSVLAFPILFMSFGPLGAALTILGVGALNTLTLAYLAESQVRSGPVLRRLGFNQIIQHYLGVIALRCLKTCLFVYCIVVLFTYTGGFLETISNALGTGGPIWFAALYLFVVWYVSPRNKTGSLLLALSIALVNLAIVAGFMVAVLFLVVSTPTEAISNDLRMAQDFVLTPVQMAIGAALYSFAGHISVSNGARLVLQRPNSEQGFLRGAVVGLGAISVLYAIWTFVAISALTSGALPQTNSVLQSMTLHFGPAVSVAAVVFIVLSLGIGSGNYAMAAHHVFSDTVRRFWTQYLKTQLLDNLNGERFTVLSLEHILGMTVVTAVMGAALLVYSLGMFDLNQFFGLIGGSMAPIIAGVFPVLIFMACRRRGVFTESRVVEFLSGRVLLLLTLMVFSSVYLWQAVTDDYAIWYRIVSAGLFCFVFWLACNLYRRATFRPGGVIVVEKGKDGWDPATWKVFEEGHEVLDKSLMWKTARNGDFQTISNATSPARILSAVRLDTSQMKTQKFDVNVVDRTMRHPVEFTVNESEPAFLEIVIGK